MRDTDISVPARYYLRLCGLLTRMSVDPQDLFVRARISPEALEQPDAQLRLSQVEKLLDLAAEMSGRTDLGIELGSTLTSSTHSIVGFGMLNSPNVERAFQFVSRFFRLVMPSFSLRYTKLPHGAVLAWTPSVGMSKSCLNFHIEAIATAAYREALELSGGALPTFRAELSIPEPPHRHRYAQLSGARWLFGVGEQPAGLGLGGGAGVSTTGGASTTGATNTGGGGNSTGTTATGAAIGTPGPARKYQAAPAPTASITTDANTRPEREDC